MTDPVTIGARAAADRLAAQYGSGLVTDVEAALHARGSKQQPERYVDPVLLGDLIVNVATLAWAIYSKRADKKTTPSTDVIVRTVRVELRNRGETLSKEQEKITNVVVNEIIRAADDREWRCRGQWADVQLQAKHAGP